MPAIDPWMTGRAITALTVQPMKMDINGNLSTNGSALSFLTILDGFRYDGQTTTEQINAAANEIDCNVPVAAADQMVVREIMRRGQGQNNLATVWENTGRREYAKITYTRSGNTRVFYGLMQDYRESGGRGKYTAELQFSFVDASGDATANPTYV